MDTKLDTAAATHLLVRTGFSARTDEVAPFLGLTRAAAVDRLLAGMRTAAHTPAPDAGTSLLSFGAPDARDRDALVKDFAREVGADEDNMKALGKELLARLAERGGALKAWWIEEMVTTPSPLTERITLVLANHFTSSLKKVKDPRLLFAQNALLRRHAGGDFAALLHAIVDDAAMLVYLDASGSTKDAPNENLARELLELFTLGEGNYTESDVKAAARALTGRRVRRIDGSVVERKRVRDTDSKTFLGKTGDLGPHDLATALLAHPRTAVTVTTKLWRELVDDALPRARIEAIAATFRARYDMKDLLRTLLREDGFWATPGGLVRSPIDLAVGCARTHRQALASATGDVQDALRAEPLARACKRMGQDPFDPPNVKGWPSGAGWATTSTIVERDRFLRTVGRTLALAGDTDARERLLDPRVQTK